MTSRRVSRLNSLLKEVISEVIHRDLHHTLANSEMLTITSVEITSDFSFAKVFVSFIGDEKAKEKICNDLNEIAGQIKRVAFRKVVMRIFPNLHFCIDEGLEKQLRICDILTEVLPKEQDEPSEDKSE